MIKNDINVKHQNQDYYSIFLKKYICMCTNKVTRWIDTQQTAHSMKCSHYLYHLLLKDLKKKIGFFFICHFYE